MPTLNWIGKDAVINHHKQVPFRLLKPIEKVSVDDDLGNLLVQGDNLEALKALLPYYAGQGRKERWSMSLRHAQRTRLERDTC